MCTTTYRDNTHQAKLAIWDTPGIWVGYSEGHLTGTYQVFNPKTKKIISTRDMTFLQKSYGEYSKVKKPVLVTMSYEGLDEEEELKMVPIINNNNNNNNIVSASDSDTDIENDNKNVFDEDIDDEVKVTSKTTINAKVVWAMKNLQLCTKTKLSKKNMPSKILTS